VVDGGEPGVDSRDEGKHTGRNDLLFGEKMMWMMLTTSQLEYASDQASSTHAYMQACMDRQAT